jgi:hypothetical protein
MTDNPFGYVDPLQEINVAALNGIRLESATWGFNELN